MDQVVPSGEARRRLPEMLRALRRDPSAGVAFVIGRHRRPEAVLIGVDHYERLRRSPAAGRASPLPPAARGEIIRLAERRGARNVRLFGSLARGEGDEQSDVDLLVEMEPGYRLLDLAALTAELAEAVDRPVDVVPDDALRPELRERVLAEAVPL